MIDKIRFLTGRVCTKPIFVIGTGRSGTNWIGEILESHPDIRVTIEVSPMFQWSTTIAMNPQMERKLLPKLLRSYKWQLFLAAPKHYADKSHPNIWIVQHLKEAFPTAHFIGTERNPFATVSSMIRHESVSAWHDRWREFPIPNRFLGITSELSTVYEGLPLAAKCALRWGSHHEEMNRLKEILGETLLVLNYESLIQDTENEIPKIQSFLELSNPFPMPEVRIESLEKWRNLLSEEQIEQIAEVLGFAP